MKKPRNSFSTLDTFTHCQRRYHYDATTPREPMSPAMARGKHVHNYLEFAAKRVLGGSTWKQGLQEGLDAELQGPLTKEELAVYNSPTLLAIMEKYEPLSTEEWFDKQLVAGVQVVGKIDLTAHCTGPVVLDYKTTGNPRKILDDYGAWMALQLRIYCLVKTFHRAGFIYLLPTGQTVERVVSFNQKDLDWTRRWLAGTVEAIESCWKSGVWSPAAPDYPWCSERWCPHWNKCYGG